jgi:hypothetical protein
VHWQRDAAPTGTPTPAPLVAANLKTHTAGCKVAYASTLCVCPPYRSCFVCVLCLAAGALASGIRLQAACSDSVLASTESFGNALLAVQQLLLHCAVFCRTSCKQYRSLLSTFFESLAASILAPQISAPCSTPLIGCPTCTHSCSKRTAYIAHTCMLCVVSEGRQR